MNLKMGNESVTGATAGASISIETTLETPEEKLPEKGQFKLLEAADPAPFKVWRERNPSPFLLVSDHAGRTVPQKLGDMGVSSEDWVRHIAWDIGIRGVAEKLRAHLGCAWIEQLYSRLVIDCNRFPGHPTSIPARSDETVIPANESLSAHARQQRENEILHPYHDAIAALLDARKNQPTLLVSLHSFTPEMKGASRPWEVGLLHDHDSENARRFQALLREDAPELQVGDNEPYALTPVNDYTVPRHGAERGLPALEIEIRQDLIADDEGQTVWAQRLARLLPRLWEKYLSETALNT